MTREVNSGLSSSIRDRSSVMATAEASTSPSTTVVRVQHPVETVTPSQPLRNALRQIVAGGSAGLVEISIMHPLDVIKTRLQIQSSVVGDPNHYNSLFDCVRKMIRNEGVFSLYKGVVPPLLAETPKRATKFFAFEQYKYLFTVDGKIGPWGLVLAGLGSGLTEGAMITPFERVKVSLQSQRSRMVDSPSTYGHARYIVKQDGFGTRGLMKGLTATLLRHGVWNTVYFGFYHNVKDLILPENSSLSSRLLVGFLAGSFASTANIPFDVAKSRIQGPQPLGQPDKYRTVLRTMALVYKEEGFFALYKGLLPKILRLGPGGGIMLVVYEQMSMWLKNNVF